ncbi:PspC domain-containing protein [Microbacterium sp. LjRoot45]|uniref:PspC domain-containing protein n=1 Tax=Microbacterium sp. LjRoot45 TaxID=3342329 RepID=UPI003ED07314
MSTDPEDRMQRTSKDRYIAGVCGGLARQLGLPPLAVRVAAVLIASVAVPVYIVLWIAVPTDG